MGRMVALLPPGSHIVPLHCGYLVWGVGCRISRGSPFHTFHDSALWPSRSPPPRKPHGPIALRIPASLTHLSHTMYSSVGLRKSTPLRNCQLIIRISNSEQ